MSNESEDVMHDAVWLGGVQPRVPAFTAKPPPALPVATSCHSDDTLVVSLAGKPPQTVTCDHFAAMMRDGNSVGVIHIGDEDGTVRTASFALFRSYIFGPAGPPGHSPPRKQPRPGASW